MRIGVGTAVHFMELLSEQISGPADKSFDLCVEGRCIARRVSSRHIAASAELCNRGIDAVKFDRLDAKVDRLDSKVDKHDTNLALVKVAVLELAKDRRAG